VTSMHVSAPLPASAVSRQPSGAATLLAVVAIAAITLAVALRVSFSSLSGLLTAFYEGQAAAAAAGLDGCVDEALLRLTRDAGFPGGSFGIGTAACAVDVQGSGAARTIFATSTVATFVNAATINVSLSGGTVSLISWLQDLD
ncbi:MAG: hypothetical protein Q7S23_01145, partial [bacterium]|nr:hypothetical protein [bacterium]